MTGDPETLTPADQVANTFIPPFVNIVKRSLKNLSFGRISMIIQYDNNGRLAMAYAGRELCASHLKCSVTDQDNGAKGRVGKSRPDGGRDGKAH